MKRTVDQSAFRRLVALTMSFGVTANNALAQSDKDHHLPLKSGAWLSTSTIERDGKLMQLGSAVELSPQFHKDEFAKGIVHEGGGKFVRCLVSEEWDFSRIKDMNEKSGCTLEMPEATAKVRVTVGSCPAYKSRTVNTLTVIDAQNYTSVTEMRMETDGKQTNSKHVSAATWLGADCKTILGERVAAVQEEVRRKQTQDAAEREATERREALRAQEQQQEQRASGNGDTAVLVQGLLQGLQQYADAKQLRKEGQSQQRVAPAQAYQQPPRQSSTSSPNLGVSGSGGSTGSTTTATVSSESKGYWKSINIPGHQGCISIDYEDKKTFREYSLKNACAMQLYVAYCLGKFCTQSGGHFADIGSGRVATRAAGPNFDRTLRVLQACQKMSGDEPVHYHFESNQCMTRVWMQ